VFSPAAERNKEPIRKALSPRLPGSGVVLEIACGTLQHACHIAPDHPGIVWQPSDINPDVLAYGSGLERPANVLAPLFLDVLSDEWSVKRADVIYTANLLHISPSGITTCLFRGAQRLEAAAAFIYGPFFARGEPAAEGNIRFDEDLRRRNSEWGIRTLQDVQTTAAASGFQLVESIPMPANNLLLHFSSAE